MSIILYKEIVYLMILAAPRAPLPKDIRQKYRYEDRAQWRE